MLLKQVRRYVPLEQLQAMFISLLEVQTCPRQRLSKKPLRVLQEALNTKASKV